MDNFEQIPPPEDKEDRPKLTEDQYNKLKNYVDQMKDFKRIPAFGTDGSERRPKVSLEDGSEYEGQWKGDIRDGQGVQTFKSGSIYEGEFKNNKFDGKGVFTWVEGDKYIGQFKNGKSEGYGIEIFTNGDRYEGEYLNDLFEGQG